MRTSANILVVGCWAMALLVTSTGTGYAQGDDKSRLGETVEKCDQRYGTPTRTGSSEGTTMYAAYTWRSYEKDGISISVWFVDGKAVYLGYKAPTAIFGTAKVEQLIEINKRGRTWSNPVQEKFLNTYTWISIFSSDGGMMKRRTEKSYSTGQSETALVVYSPDAFTPSTIADNKAQYEQYSKSGSIDGL